MLTSAVHWTRPYIARNTRWWL